MVVDFPGLYQVSFHQNAGNFYIIELFLCKELNTNQVNKFKKKMLIAVYLSYFVFVPLCIIILLL